MLRLHPLEDPREIPQGIGTPEHPQGMPRRRGVHHDEVVGPTGRKPLDLQERGQFVDPRYRQPQQP